MTPKVKISTARYLAMGFAPYFSAMLYKLTFKEVPPGTLPMPTLGVTDRAICFYEKAFVDQVSEKQLAAVIIHEVNHLVRHHSKRCGTRDKTKWNLAGDCLAPESRILMADGTEQRLEDVRSGDWIMGVQRGQLVPGQVLLRMRRRRGGPGVELHHVSGVLRSTYDHRYLTHSGYLPLKEILGQTQSSAQVFRLRDGIPQEVRCDSDTRGDGVRPRSSLPECAIGDEATRAGRATSYGEAQEPPTHQATPAHGDRLPSGHCGWGGYNLHRTPLQQALEQDLLPTRALRSQHKQRTAGVVQEAGLYLSLVQSHVRWAAMLEAEYGRAGAGSSPADFAALLGREGQAGDFGDRILQHALQAATQRQANPADAPALSRGATLELQDCRAVRVQFAKAEVFYDLITTCHSFIADGFAVHNCEINDDLQAMRLPLPGVPVVPELLGCERGLTAEEYYAKMEEQEGKRGGKRPPDPNGVGAGQCGGCSGNKNPNEDKDDPQKGQGQAGQDPVQTAGSERSEAEMEMARDQVAQAIQQCAQKGRGSVPAGLARWADAQLAPPKIPWETRLARACRRLVNHRPGATDYRFSRWSRHQAALGWGPNKPILPGLVEPIPNVAVGLDTSGSMGQDQILAGARETAGIMKAVGVGVTFVACDAAVHAVKKVETPQQLASCIKGGGGTDFRPIFKAVEDLSPRPEVFVFITDGCGPAPSVPPTGVQVIWLLVGPHKQRPYASDKDGYQNDGAVDYGVWIEMDD